MNRDPMDDYSPQGEGFRVRVYSWALESSRRIHRIAIGY
jgi:hypothetical protein